LSSCGIPVGLRNPTTEVPLDAEKDVIMAPGVPVLVKRDPATTENVFTCSGGF